MFRSVGLYPTEYGVKPYEVHQRAWFEIELAAGAAAGLAYAIWQRFGLTLLRRSSQIINGAYNLMKCRYHVIDRVSVYYILYSISKR